MSPRPEEWRWDPQGTPETAERPAQPVPPAAPVTPPPQNMYTPQNPYAQKPPYAPPPYGVPAYYEPPQETDPQKPLWQAVIGPLTPMEWKTVRRRYAFGWCYGLCALLAMLLGTAALSGQLNIAGIPIYRGLLFFPLHLMLLGLSLIGYFVFYRRRSLRERAELAVYGWMEVAGRTVTVYCDRIEAVGLRDTVTVLFDGAVLREWLGVLTVEKDGACVAVRAADITAAEAAALTALLYPRVSDRRGKRPFCSYLQTVERRPAPQQRADAPEYVARVTYTRGAAVQDRIAELFGGQMLMWLPLAGIATLMITDGWAKGNSTLLYYMATLLIVLCAAVLLLIAGVLIGTLSDPALPQPLELRFYSDRLQVQTPKGSVVCPRELVSLKLDKAYLTVTAPQKRWELSLKDVEDPQALRRFLTGED